MLLIVMCPTIIVEAFLKNLASSYSLHGNFKNMKYIYHLKRGIKSPNIPRKKSHLPLKVPIFLFKFILPMLLARSHFYAKVSNKTSLVLLDETCKESLVFSFCWWLSIIPSKYLECLSLEEDLFRLHRSHITIKFLLNIRGMSSTIYLCHFWGSRS